MRAKSLTRTGSRCPYCRPQRLSRVPTWRTTSRLSAFLKGNERLKESKLATGCRERLLRFGQGSLSIAQDPGSAKFSSCSMHRLIERGFLS